MIASDSISLTRESWSKLRNWSVIDSDHIIRDDHALGASHGASHAKSTGKAATGRAGAAGHRALLQPRAFVAAVQPARARGGAKSPPSAARAGAVPVDLGLEPRRILHGPRRRHLRTDRSRRHHAVAGWAHAAPAAGRDQPLRRQAGRRQAGLLEWPQDGVGGGRPAYRRTGRAEQRGTRVAP